MDGDRVQTGWTSGPNLDCALKAKLRKMSLTDVADDFSETDLPSIPQKKLF